MYKVLIIDDERHARQAIRALGNWQEFGINTILEASNGESGLRLMREFTPDIVLIDIRMPIMNGMDFLKNAAAEFSSAKYIVVSGYGEFKYAQEAIRYNAKDYLLKPVVEEELNNIIKRVVQELNNEKKSGNQNPMIRVTKRLTARYMRESHKEEYYGIAVLYGINTNDAPNCSINDRIPDIIKENWDHASSCFSIADSDKETLLVITISEKSPAYSENSLEMSQYAALAVKKIIHILKEKHKLYVIAGVGGFTSQIHYLYGSYWEAVNIVNSINLLDDKKAVYIQEESGNTTKMLSVIDRKELFKRAFEKGNTKYAKDIIEKYFQARTKNGYLSIDDLRRITLEFIIIFREIAIEREIPNYREVLPSIRDQNELRSFENAIELTNYIVELFNNLHNNEDKAQCLSIKDIIQEIKDYIEDNYFAEISLGMFAEKYYMTKEYLSKQFKEEFGYGIYEHALNIRMEKAAEILLDSEIKIQELSQRLGYTDNNYFSRAFKNYYGVSPKKYRETIQLTSVF